MTPIEEPVETGQAVAAVKANSAMELLQPFMQGNLPEVTFPVLIQGPGIDCSATPQQPPAPLIPQIRTSSESANSVAWPGVAWLILLIHYMHRYAPKLDSVYSWAKYAPDMGGLPRNLTRKPDHHGNMWEITAAPDLIILTKTPNDAQLRAAETALDTIRRAAGPLMTDYFNWKRRVPQRTQDNADTLSIKEAQENRDRVREELEVMMARYNEAYGILANSTKTEYRIPISSFENVIEYDMQLEVLPPVPVFARPPQPIQWPDLDSDNFFPEQDLRREAARVGALR